MDHLDNEPKSEPNNGKNIKKHNDWWFRGLKLCELNALHCAINIS